MKYYETTALEKIREMEKRIRVVQGGTSGGKTIAILLNELDNSIREPNIVTSVITDTFPNLRIGAMRDFLDICHETNVLQKGIWNKTDHCFYLPNGSIIEFYSIDTMGALGARRDRLYINEANRISWDTFSQLEVRTRQRITIDFNPVNEFWAHTELLKRPDVDFVKLTYKDNEALDIATKQAIEMRRGDGNNNWWRVYGLGEVGSLEGNIYSGWTPLEEVPEGFILKRYGVDFGFSNDPTAVVGIYENEAGDIFLKLHLYESKLLTPHLIERLKQLPPALFVCDNSRPEIIAEMQASGLQAIGCDKTPGEKMNGKRYNIELVLRRKIFYLAEDTELEKEYLCYAWRKRKGDGKIIDEPEDGNDHAMDAVAYGIRDLSRKPIEYAGVR